MPRIISDSYSKTKKHIWGKDANSKFNKKIVAVNRMYGWLYEKGILQNVSFEMRDYSDVTFFAFDTKDLEPYRKAMAKAGVKDAKIAVRHIFDEEYTPCKYSGAIELGWTMMGYRDFDGTVSGSWECDLVKHLSSGAVLDVEERREKEGVRAAVKLAFELSGFYPSDITKGGELMAVKPLGEADRNTVENLDEMSGNHLSDMLEDNEDYAWGLFIGERLVGYCSIGYADEFVDDGKGNGYPKCTSDSLLLGDVFIAPEYRGQGCGAYLVDKSIRLCREKNKQRVFLTVLDDRLSHFYEKIGFSMIGNGAMVRDERSSDEKKLEKVFDQAFAFYSNIDKSLLGQRDYLYSHAEKLIECYERGEKVLDLIDVDCWVRYENLLAERLDYEEYCAVNAVLDGDPHDIEEDDAEKISFLRDALQNYRDNGYSDESHSLLSLIDGANLRTEEPQAQKGTDKEIGHGPW